MKILTGARSSKLSRAQVAEIKEELFRIRPDVELEPVWADSPGDRDKETSLRNLPKNDFFTRDLDEMLRAGKVRIAVHSAKDLPDPIPKGLSLIALTRGQDPRDSLVMRTGESFERLKPDARIATSSSRREEIVTRSSVPSRSRSALVAEGRGLPSGARRLVRAYWSEE